MKLKTLLILFIIPLFTTGCKQKEGVLEVSVDYQQQDGWASNQFAAWIEDEAGNYINTLFVTKYSTTEHALNERPDCVPVWVSKAQPAKMAVEELDAITMATPNSGIVTYAWDLKDKQGNKVKRGTYVFVLEATLLWDSRVIFKNNIDLGKKPVTVLGISEFTRPDSVQNKGMIRSVVADYKLIDAK